MAHLPSENTTFSKYHGRAEAATPGGPPAESVVQNLAKFIAFFFVFGGSLFRPKFVSKIGVAKKCNFPADLCRKRPRKTPKSASKWAPEGPPKRFGYQQGRFPKFATPPKRKHLFSPPGGFEMDDFFAPGGLWEGACNAPLKKTAPSARLAPKGVQKEVPKTILRGMIFHQISERKLVKLVFSPGRCCEFRDFDIR